MTVKELREILGKYPDDMKVITDLYSDYTDMPTPEICKVIPNASNDYYATYYPNQHPDPPVVKVIEVLYFRGN